ncbi:hypothetical protein Ctob_016251 [Chrysochromulina tobinii]|eukprot:KOO34158.1 hypothetical protein Ctob_016251 [Chrysochromulina sp. CCMP291]
MQSEP